MNAKSLNWIISLIFFVITAGAFYWLWTISKDFTVETIVAENLKPIVVEGVKKEADELLTGRTNNASIPIPTPSEKMGKTNPFN